MIKQQEKRTTPHRTAPLHRTHLTEPHTSHTHLLGVTANTVAHGDRLRLLVVPVFSEAAVDQGVLAPPVLRKSIRVGLFLRTLTDSCGPSGVVAVWAVIDFCELPALRKRGWGRVG